MTPAETIKAIHASFDAVLGRYGLQAVAEEAGGSHAEVHFENRTTALTISVEWMEFRPFLEIAQLGSSLLAEEEAGSHTVGFPRRAFDLDDLLTVRAAHPSPVGKMPPGGDAGPLLVLLAEYADAIDRYAGDVLRGDFTVFAALNRTVDERIALLNDR